VGEGQRGEQRAESRKQRAESREQRAESREQRAESREQRAESKLACTDLCTLRWCWRWSTRRKGVERRNACDPRCYIGVTVVLQWCYSGVTVVLYHKRKGVGRRNACDPRSQRKYRREGRADRGEMCGVGEEGEGGGLSFESR
jgi:hypothetical protein